MKSYQVRKLDNFHLTTTLKFSMMFNIIILISRNVSVKFNNVLKKYCCLTNSHIMTHFDAPGKQAF